MHVWAEGDRLYATDGVRTVSAVFNPNSSILSKAGRAVIAILEAMLKDPPEEE